jgi:hypothetical protein
VVRGLDTRKCGVGAQRIGVRVGVNTTEPVHANGCDLRAIVGETLHRVQDTRMLDRTDHDVAADPAAGTGETEHPELHRLRPRGREGDLVRSPTERSRDRRACAIEEQPGPSPIGVEAVRVSPTVLESAEHRLTRSRMQWRR